MVAQEFCFLFCFISLDKMQNIISTCTLEYLSVCVCVCIMCVGVCDYTSSRPTPFGAESSNKNIHKYLITIRRSVHRILIGVVR